jgi:hypothetical protein
MRSWRCSTSHQVNTVLSPYCTLTILYSHHTVLSPHCTPTTPYSHHTVLPPHCTPTTPYSHHTVLPPHHTPTTLYSHHTLLPPYCTPTTLYSHHMHTLLPPGPTGPCYGLEKDFSGASDLGKALAPWTNVGSLDKVRNAHTVLALHLTVYCTRHTLLSPYCTIHSFFAPGFALGRAQAAPPAEHALRPPLR